MPYCQQCGTEYDPDAEFCPECGNTVRDARDAGAGRPHEETQSFQPDNRRTSSSSIGDSVDFEGRRGKTVTNALIGVGASIPLSFFVPVLPVAIGGGLAGYLQGMGKGEGAKVGALTGVFAGVLSTLLLFVFFFVFGISVFMPMGGTAEAMAGFGSTIVGFVLVAGVIATVVSTGLGAVGGLIGGLIQEEESDGFGHSQPPGQQPHREQGRQARSPESRQNEYDTEYGTDYGGENEQQDDRYEY